MNLEASRQGCFTLPSQGKFNTRAMGSLRLTCQVEKAEFADIVRPSGDVDLSTTSILGHALATAFSQGRHVIVDLSEVTYLDSTGLRELLAHHRILWNRSCKHGRGAPRSCAEVLTVGCPSASVLPRSGSRW